MVNVLRSKARDLRTEKYELKIEVNELRTQKIWFTKSGARKTDWIRGCETGLIEYSRQVYEIDSKKKIEQNCFSNV